MQIVKDLQEVLRFYKELGFETLPFRLDPNSLRFSQHSDLSADAKKSLLEELQRDVSQCRLCQLSSTRNHIVFGEGNPDSKLMFIGEAPGREEDLQGSPFVGDAGKVLTRLIEKMGFQRNQVYIANIVKCRPPSNRDPGIDEIKNCRGFLDQQIAIIQPRVIMTLGRIAVQTLLENMNVKMTSIRGKLLEYRGITLIPTFHPAYLMRNPKDKWLTWDDALKVLENLNQPG